jgi:2-desacetyl-2-hydroxyethyl bacteriochlorophyllide A dehydrogenase
MVLVRPRRIGICGTDYHIFEGKHPYLAYPRVMGHEVAAEIVDAPAASGFAPGDIVTVNPYLSCGTCKSCRAGKPNCCVNITVLGVHRDGCMTELVSLPPENLIRAEGLSIDGCASVEFLAIGAHAVRRGGVGPSDNVLVVGAGPIGLGVALFAGIAGARVHVLDLDPERITAARTIAGAMAVPADGDIDAAVRDLTKGEGFDVVLDATGSRRAMEKGFDFVTHGGRYVFVSVVNDTVTFSDPGFHSREMTLLGSRNADTVDFAHVIDSIRTGKVPLDKIVTHRTSLCGAVEDLPIWAAHKTGLIKAMIEID